jgi:two-component system, cell cycle sensor histidine kinase and response regulator CckA
VSQLVSPEPSQRLRRALRWFSLAGVVPLVALVVVELLLLPMPAETPLVAGTGGFGLLLLASLGAIAGQRRKGLAVLVAGLLDLGSIVAGANLAAGNDAAIVMPFIGAVVLVSALEDRQLAFGLFFGWLAGAVGCAVAFTTPGLSSLPDATPPLLEGAIALALTAPGYAMLGWVAERRRVATERALAAAESARRAELAQQRTAETLRVLVESSPLPTLAFDLEGTVHAWNPAAVRLLGWSADEVVGRPVISFVPEDLHPGVRVRMSTALNGGRLAGARRTRFIAKNGREFVVEIHDAIERDAEGRPAGVVVQFLDLTDREAMEARLMESQRLEAVGQLAGGVAHDFNNSLTAIAGFASLIATGASPDPADDAQTILGAAEHAARLTRQLLAFSRRVPLQPEVVDVPVFLAGVEPLVRSLVGASIHVHLEPGHASCRIRADAATLEQAILNLAANSRDAMPHGGELTLGCRVQPDCSDGDSEPKEHVAVYLSDSGTGIPPENMHRLFEPFFTTKPPGSGTGLGLPMVHGFVAQSGGHVVVTSPPGRGATFEMHFPPSVDRPGTAPTAPEFTGGTESILYVEDDPAVASFGLACLRRLGYDVTPAMNASDAVALAAAREDPFDLLLTDVVLPGMSGLELASVIHRRHPSTAILFASGYSAEWVDQMPVPRARLLEKPYSLEGLAGAVREVLDSASSLHRENENDGDT